MSDRPRIGLDNTTFRGRLRQPQRLSRPVRPHSTEQRQRRVGDIHKLHPSQQVHTLSASSKPAPKEVLIQPAQSKSKLGQSMAGMDISPASKPIQKQVVLAPEVRVVQAQPYAEPAVPKMQRSQVLRRTAVTAPVAKLLPKSRIATIKKSDSRLKINLQQYSSAQLGLVGMALFIFLVGLFVSIQTFQTNNNATAQVAALSEGADSAGTTEGNGDTDPLPSTVKPSAKAIASYVVAPDLPKYISIPKLGVKARVLQVGIKTNGEMATPSNVHDAAWYTGSAKPGQVGATLIDGHLSSWTTKGVFYGIKNLPQGTIIQITKGDGTVLSYKIVKIQTYDADRVDMQAAITPVTAGKSGLNLITCGGKVKKNTNEFTERTVVFTEQV